MHSNNKWRDYLEHRDHKYIKKIRQPNGRYRYFYKPSEIEAYYNTRKNKAGDKFARDLGRRIARKMRKDGDTLEKDFDRFDKKNRVIQKSLGRRVDNGVRKMKRSSNRLYKTGKRQASRGLRTLEKDFDRFNKKNRVIRKSLGRRVDNGVRKMKRSSNRLYKTGKRQASRGLRTLRKYFNR